MSLEAFMCRAMEVGGSEPETAWVAADLVERGESDVSVERRVLDAFRHHGTGRLLPTDDELIDRPRPLSLEQHDTTQIVRENVRGTPVFVFDAAGTGLDV